MDGDASFGHWLRQRRKALRLSVVDLAQRVGCATVTLHKIEADERRPSQQIAAKLADQLAIALTDRPAFIQAARGQFGVERLASLVTPNHRRTNLPTQPSRLIGRAREVAQVCTMLGTPDVRLVTFTGSGGIGKTRLALQVASEVLDDFADGVWLVELASVIDPSLVLSTIAQALGVQESSAQPLFQSLTIHLRAKQLLLVLDNFEHVIAAATKVADLLGAAPQLTVLVTSREVLHLYREHEFPVPSLSIPDVQRLPALVELNKYEAVRLFVERGQAVHPDFVITDETAPAVAEICQRLDGLPLAIELAAARVRLLPPQAMLGRLDDPLTFLTGGWRDVPARQQTLRATIDWSYNLLSVGEQQLLARLAVFVGGWTIEMAEAICAGDSLPFTILDGMEALTAKSLVQRQANRGHEPSGAPRFGMLETIREYALQRLEASGETVAIRSRHLQFFRDLAEAAEPYLHSPEQMPWLIRLDQELPNIRATLMWSMEQITYDDGFRLAAALHRFWHIRSHDLEGYQWLKHFLAAPQPAARATRARALSAIAFFAKMCSDLEQAQAWAAEGIIISRAIGDTPSLIHSLIMLGWSTRETGRSIALMDEALDEARTLGDPWWIAMALWFQSENYIRRDDAQAQALMEASLPIFRRIGDDWSIGVNLAELGHVVHRRGQYDYATALFEESLVRLRSVGQNAGIAMALHGLGKIAYDQGDYARAAALLDDALPGFRMQGNRTMVANILCSRSRVALAQRNTELAARLLEESLALYISIDDTVGQAQVLYLLGQVARQQGDIAHANMRLTESLRLRQDGAPSDMLESIEGLGSLAVAAQHWPESRPLAALRAARLLSAAAALRDMLKLPLPPGDRPAYEQDVAAARGQVDETACAMAWAEGQAMTLEQAIAEALAES